MADRADVVAVEKADSYEEAWSARPNRHPFWEKFLSAGQAECTRHHQVTSQSVNDSFGFKGPGTKIPWKKQPSK